MISFSLLHHVDKLNAGARVHNAPSFTRFTHQALENHACFPFTQHYGLHCLYHTNTRLPDLRKRKKSMFVQVCPGFDQEKLVTGQDLWWTVSPCR